MKTTTTRPFPGWMCFLLLAALLATIDQPALNAQDQAPVKKRLGKKVRRLPTYYSSVVDEKQRDAIYKIQEEYRPKIAELETQLKALKKERDDKISAVLTDEQKKQVEAAKAKPIKKDALPAKPLKEGAATPANEKKPAEPEKNTTKKGK
jgi:hypothetical protein